MEYWKLETGLLETGKQPIGKWKMASWKLETCQLETGKQANGKWKMAYWKPKSCLLETGKQAHWQLETICHLVLEVNDRRLLPEAGRPVPLLLGVEVELDHPHRAVAAADGVVGRVLDHDLDGPVAEHVHL